jgi:hypothetical protein
MGGGTRCRGGGRPNHPIDHPSNCFSTHPPWYVGVPSTLPLVGITRYRMSVIIRSAVSSAVKNKFPIEEIDVR